MEDIGEIFAIAKRENNQKRNYLVVNRLQGKYIPVHPKQALNLFGQLGERVEETYFGERLLLIGFAETATAIGAALAVKLNTWYVQTTREQIEGAQYLEFLEVHSHAPEQRLVCNGLDAVLNVIDRVVFVEDELTTGNTIINLVHQIKKAYPGAYRFAAASILNGMDISAMERFSAEGIEAIFLLKTDNSYFSELAEQAKVDGRCWVSSAAKTNSISISWQEVTGCINARKCIYAKEYQSACERLWEQIRELAGEEKHRRILILGTEEFMYPALYAGSRLEEENEVFFHATSRSPILVSCEAEYPLHSRFELVSLYEKNRKTFLYNLQMYDQVIVLTDAPSVCSEGAYTLACALENCGNQKVQWIRWC